MEIFFTVAILGIIIMSCITFFIGKKIGKPGENNEKVLSLESRIAELTNKLATQEGTINDLTRKITELTSERDVQKTNAENATKQLESQRLQYEKQLSDKVLSYDKQIEELKSTHEKRIGELKQESADEKKAASERQAKAESDIRALYEKQIAELKTSHKQQVEQSKESTDKQLATIREMNKEQVEALKTQMRTTSEDVLKARQKELEVQNKEQVSKIIDPLQKSLKDMEQALNSTKEQQKEALTRLDETIKQNMEKSANLGKTADRLTRALTGEVKVQGNFGELKLKQLLEDLELKEGEQFDTQETLKDNTGKGTKGDDGKGLVPDFILHFPNNRHVVVDSKMSLTDYERYMNTEDGVPEKSLYLKAHIDSVRAQVKRLAKKEYTKYLPEGYNRLNFAIMYVPIEGALNLALLNDTTLWREAYDQGVMILGPQTMYMNLRVLEMMWTQVRQLKNQQTMIDAANTIIDRVQDFGIRFMDVESSMNDTIKKITKLKITTADNGSSIITAARNLLKAGAKENKKKKGLAEMDDSIFIEADSTLMLPPSDSKEPVDDNNNN